MIRIFFVSVLFACNLSLSMPIADELLLAAATEGDCDRIRSAIEKGASVDTKNAEGETPLGIAKRHGHAAAVDVLEKS